MGENNANIQQETRSAPVTTPKPQYEPGWYISEVDGNKYKQWETIENERKAVVAFKPAASSSAISDSSAIIDEVRQAIRAELMQNFKALGIKPSYIK